MSSFVGAIAVADLVKTTLGPKGMDKILQSVSDPNNMRITITDERHYFKKCTCGQPRGQGTGRYSEDAG